MTFQREMEARTIAVLYARVHSGSELLTREALKKVVQDQWNVSDYRFSDAFANLETWGYLKDEAPEGKESMYRLSAYGVDWFEGWYYLQWNTKTNFTMYQRHDGIVMLNELRSNYERRIAKEKADKKTRGMGPIDWTKWGAIAAVIAIPVAIFIWWYS